ncbi:hypothetical protein ACWCP6_25470 [Streptomyces sp. NPDC002004]
MTSAGFLVSLDGQTPEEVTAVDGLALTWDEGGVPGCHMEDRRPEASPEVVITRGGNRPTAFTRWARKTSSEGVPDTASPDLAVAVTDAANRPVTTIRLVQAIATDVSVSGPDPSSPLAERITVACAGIRPMRP